ncbi:50S ribosomal protein L4 [Planctomicrobium piriforme]|uniref:Large ribosomal subunit protein uL4 n=1 Tax=Planctomicrobium piriforme TaxID=1576369 RepID=A0A1I3C8D4_9PLAN|nr:50S ribosomal protein L4 [Planctomicrobium piriforme]SFH70576.1 large subunit ribosomal protein L4 [Planctomicrobium piriforme]
MSENTKISAPVRGMDGKSVGSYEFDGSDLAAKVSKQLLHDVIVMYETNQRQGSVRTKNRGEVAGSTKKLFRQKGTGNARVGTKRSPIRRGGGHTFAKRPKDWSYRLPRRAVQTATRMALLSKFQDNEATVLDSFAIADIKTKTVSQMLKALGVAAESCLLVIPDHDIGVWKSGRNISNLWISPVKELNAYQLLHQKRLLITREAIDQARQANQEAVAAS